MDLRNIEENVLKVYDYSLELVKDQEKEWISKIRKRIETQAYKTISPKIFFREYVKVVFTSGFKEKIVRDNWETIEKVLCDFDPEKIQVMKYEQLIENSPIRNIKKLKAILSASKIVTSKWLIQIHNADSWEKIHYILNKDLSYIGPVTVFHLMRNIGIDCYKFDTHIKSLAQGLEIEASEIFNIIIKQRNEQYRGIVDYTLWKACETLSGAENLLEKALSK